MKLNTLKPAPGSKKVGRRVGRGIGSGLGKTCGRGHKGQTSRTGGKIKPGFEGGQMPLHRRLPKFGFTSRQSLVREEIRLDVLSDVEASIINLKALIKAGCVRRDTQYVKVIAAGELKKAVHLKGIKVTRGAKEKIESKGGKVEE
ncbi:MAG TPA: 50S ribosomal protein L15 [Coxiellaceae bacterium]|nr:50S ribosomal protein L15 [Coxiellaceae bacterium]